MHTCMYKISLIVRIMGKNGSSVFSSKVNEGRKKRRVQNLCVFFLHFYFVNYMGMSEQGDLQHTKFLN